MSRITAQFLVSVSAAALLCTANAKDDVWRVPTLPKIPARKFVITEFGAIGDGHTMNTEAFRSAIQACAKAGGGHVIVPAGTFLTGPIELASHMALDFEEDAIIQASDKFSDFGLPDPLPDTQAELEGLRKQLKPLISGSKLEDVAILGMASIIDGAGAVWWAKSDKAVERAKLLPVAPMEPNLDSFPRLCCMCRDRISWFCAIARGSRSQASPFKTPRCFISSRTAATMSPLNLFPFTPPLIRRTRMESIPQTARMCSFTVA